MRRLFEKSIVRVYIESRVAWKVNKSIFEALRGQLASFWGQEMKIYALICHKLVLTQLWPKVVSWRFEKNTDVLLLLSTYWTSNKVVFLWTKQWFILFIAALDLILKCIFPKIAEGVGWSRHVAVTSAVTECTQNIYSTYQLRSLNCFYRGIPKKHF